MLRRTFRRDAAIRYRLHKTAKNPLLSGVVHCAARSEKQDKAGVQDKFRRMHTPLAPRREGGYKGGVSGAPVILSAAKDLPLQGIFRYAQDDTDF